MAVRGSPPLSEQKLLATYPFLPGAERLTETLSLSIRGLVVDPAYARARELGHQRVLAAADDPTLARELGELVHATPEERFLSFLYARLLLAAAPQAAAGRRWAVAEAKRAFGLLLAAGTEELTEVATRLGYSVEGGPKEFTLPLAEYLRLATPVREAAFRLVQQPLRRGRVTLRRDRLARLLQEGIRLKLTPPLPLTPDLVEAIRGQESTFYDEVARHMPLPAARAAAASGSVRPEFFPPCIRKFRRMLQEGENLSHSGRFALAAFLHRVGADMETIVDQYRGAPDFDEGITRYQVEHITRRDEGRGYEPPECATLRSHGLCFREGDPTARAEVDRQRDPLCFEEWMTHPLKYYGAKLRGRPPLAGEATAPRRGAAEGSARSRPRGPPPSTGRR